MPSARWTRVRSSHAALKRPLWHFGHLVATTLWSGPAVPLAETTGLHCHWAITICCHAEGYFKYPVTDEQAPGYSKFIKQPICFEKMREKVHARQYRTW